MEKEYTREEIQEATAAHGFFFNQDKNQWEINITSSLTGNSCALPLQTLTRFVNDHNLSSLTIEDCRDIIENSKRQYQQSEELRRNNGRCVNDFYKICKRKEYRKGSDGFCDRDFEECEEFCVILQRPENSFVPIQNELIASGLMAYKQIQQMDSEIVNSPHFPHCEFISKHKKAAATHEPRQLSEEDIKKREMRQHFKKLKKKKRKKR